MIHLQSELLSATIDPKGAELQSLRRLDTGIEYLWNGDPSFWGKHSPVLFPIVGTLRENKYLYEGKAYGLPRHGFARDKVFDVGLADNLEGFFMLSDDPSTLEVYPFPFQFSILYRLDGVRLEVRYEVHNPGRGPMYFSLGGHPAFAVPLVPNTAYGDYHLIFSKPETAGRHILENGLLREDVVPFLNNEQLVPLTHELFADDAIVLSGLKSQAVTLGSEKTPHGLRFHIEGWPDLGIWAAPNAPFVCIEPWQGHADFVDHDQQLVYKPGIVCLGAGETWSRSWAVEVF